MAVLVALEDRDYGGSGKGGEIVRLADLGTFQIGPSGTGAETRRIRMMCRLLQKRVSISVRVLRSAVILAATDIYERG
jgi:hypothetical protein